DDRARLLEHAAEQDGDDRRDDEDQDHVADPVERHRGRLSATSAAFFAMPGSALRMMSNCALIALTAGSSGRRCSSSTVDNATARAARFADVVASRLRTSMSATATTATTTMASRTLSSTSV